MISVAKLDLRRTVAPTNRVEPEATKLHGGRVQKLVLKDGVWKDRRWNLRWLELHKGELRYFRDNGEKMIDRIPADQVAEIKPVMADVSKLDETGTQSEQATAVFTEFSGGDKQYLISSSASLLKPTLWNIVSTQKDDNAELQLCFFICTKTDKDHRGREYVFKTTSLPELQEWIEAIRKMLADSVPPPMTLLTWTRTTMRNFYQSTAFQLFVAFLILTNFLAYVWLTQFNPDAGSATGKILSTLDVSLSIAFGVELLINLFCHDFFQEFLPDIWNWFDLVVVITSLIAIPFDGVPGLNGLRLVRVLRIFRLFKSIQSLSKIVYALQESLPAVGNALFLVMLMSSIYAILGVTFFGETDPTDFGDFGTTMFTLFQFLTFDNACSVTLNLMQLEESDGGQLGAALFMITFQIGMAYTLMNIGMAVLLEEFGASSKRAREEDEARRLAKIRESNRKPLDAIMANLITLDAADGLKKEIEELFQFIDEDGSGSIDFIEMRNGFMRMELNPPINFQSEDFDNIVINAGLHVNGNMSLEHFMAMMYQQLREYEVTLMNKSVLEGRVNDKVNTILRSLRDVVSATRAIKGLERQVLDLDHRFSLYEANIPPG